MLQASVDEKCTETTTNASDAYTFVSEVEYEFVGGGNAVNGY